MPRRPLPLSTGHSSKAPLNPFSTGFSETVDDGVSRPLKPLVSLSSAALDSDADPRVQQTELRTTTAPIKAHSSFSLASLSSSPGKSGFPPPAVTGAGQSTQFQAAVSSSSELKEGAVSASSKASSTALASPTHSFKCSFYLQRQSLPPAYILPPDDPVPGNPLPFEKTHQIATGGESAQGDGRQRAAQKPVKNQRLTAESERRWMESHRYVVGVDEAGRGPLAGPLVVAACILPQGIDTPLITDSKAMTEEEREEAFGWLTSTAAVTWVVCEIGRDVIDELNILRATMEGMCAVGLKAIEECDSRQSHCCSHFGHNGQSENDSSDRSEAKKRERVKVVVDGNRVPSGLIHSSALDVEAIVKGDSKIRSIAAASVLAKVTRDRLMAVLDAQYPKYGFRKHKGYGTRDHMQAIAKHGPCPVHRWSFQPMKSMKEEAEKKEAAASAKRNRAFPSLTQPASASTSPQSPPREDSDSDAKWTKFPKETPKYTNTSLSAKQRRTATCLRSTAPALLKSPLGTHPEKVQTASQRLRSRQKNVEAKKSKIGVTKKKNKTTKANYRTPNG